MKQFRSLAECITYFQDDRFTWDYFEKMRWNDKPVCPYCGNEQVYRTADYRRFKCGDKTNCNKKFSATVGTIFENTKIPLKTWFAAIYLCTAHKKGVSSCQLARDLGITQKTGWFMFHRIREMLTNGMGITLKNVVAIDETYFKGKRANKSKHIRKLIAAGLMEDKESVVLGMIETGGSVVYKVVANAEAETLKVEINKVVPDKNAILVTDGHSSYPAIAADYAAHEVVNHSIEEYVNASGFTTNNIESAFALFQRGVYGIYHHVSHKHLQRYCHEFAYRFNSRKVKDFERFILTMESKHMVGRLTYKALVGKKSVILSNGQGEENTQASQKEGNPAEGEGRGEDLP